MRRSTRIAEKRRRYVYAEEKQDEEEQAVRETIELGNKEKFEGCVYDDLRSSHLRRHGAGPGTRGQQLRDERTIAYLQPESSPPYHDDLTGKLLNTAKASEFRRSTEGSR